MYLQQYARFVREYLEYSKNPCDYQRPNDKNIDENLMSTLVDVGGQLTELRNTLFKMLEQQKVDYSKLNEAIANIEKDVTERLNKYYLQK